MEEITQWQIETLDDARRQLKGSIQRATQNFVEIGYTLRRVLETKCYQGEYESLQDFAKQEFGISASQVSRFMTIHEEFGKAGTPELDDKWKDFSQTKLIEMLNLDENTREALDPDVKRDDIRELREEVEEAKEQAREEAFTAAVTGEEQETPIDRIIIPLLIKKKDRFKGIYKQVLDPGTEEDIRMAVSDSGFGFVRAGAGMVFLKDKKVVVNIGSDQNEYTYHDLLDAMRRIADPEGVTAERYYEALTGETLKEKEPAGIVKNGASKENDTKKAKTAPKKVKKPEVIQCGQPVEDVKNEPEEKANPMPVPDSEAAGQEVDVVDPGEVEAKDIKDNQTCSITYRRGDTGEKWILEIDHDDQRATVLRNGDYIVGFNIDYCPKCGEKL